MKKLPLLFTLLISINCLGQVPAYVPSDSLVAWYSFNGNANDETGNGNDGLLIGPPTSVNDRFGTANAAYDFNNLSNYIDIPDNNSLDLTTDLTISVWVHPNGSYGTGPVYNAVVDKW